MYEVFPFSKKVYIVGDCVSKILTPAHVSDQIQSLHAITEQPPREDEFIPAVDDEESVCSLAKDMLENYGYRVLLAEHGEESSEILKENHGFIELMISGIPVVLC